MREMNAADYRRFLLDRARRASLATVRADGRPHVVPVCFDLDGDTFLFTTGETTTKARNMRRDARVSLCIDDEEPPFTFVLVEGMAEMTTGDPDLFYWPPESGAVTLAWSWPKPTAGATPSRGELLVGWRQPGSSPARTSPSDTRARDQGYYRRRAALRLRAAHLFGR